MRINKYIAKSGFASRHDADELIKKGLVTINGEIADIGSKVPFGAIVEVKGRTIRPKEEDVFYAFHKPKGILSSFNEEIANSLLPFLPEEDQLRCAGNLDAEASGLLILTNNHEVAQKLLSPNGTYEKEYLVRLNKPFTRAFVDALKRGVNVHGTILEPVGFRKKTDTQFYLTTTAEKSDDIYLMCQTLGYEVRALKRLRIMNVRLRTLGEGNLRILSKKERRGLLEELS